MPANDQGKQSIEVRLESPERRRELRGTPGLSPEIADRLLSYENDFRLSRLDHTLGCAVQRASHQALLNHAGAIAAGSAAADLWQRLASDPDQLSQLAMSIAQSASPPAPRITISLLVLDPLDSLDIGQEAQASIAQAALQSNDEDARGLAAEFLSDVAPQRVLPHLENLTHDPDERVRGHNWYAGFRADAQESWNLAVNILGDESTTLDVRRSALVAAGRHLETSQVEDLLAYFVTHPTEELASDAAQLFYLYHRTPVIAMAAMQSPHPAVQDVARTLMDPYRGSPAAGGSRPGDPTGGDAFANFMRQLSRDPDETDEPEHP